MRLAEAPPVDSEAVRRIKDTIPAEPIPLTWNEFRKL